MAIFPLLHTSQGRGGDSSRRAAKLGDKFQILIDNSFVAPLYLDRVRTMSRVSIVLPTFNRVRFLGDAISSALAQSYADLELLVVDDGSTDGTAELVQKFAHDKRVRYFHQENAGVSAARNLAIRAATGDFIAFLDSDDVWLPHKLALQIGLLNRRPDVGMVWTNMDAIRPDGTLLKPNYLRTMYGAYDHLREELFPTLKKLVDVVPECPKLIRETPVGIGNIYHAMFGGNLVHTPTVVLRRSWAETIGLFDVSMRRGGEDYKYHLATSRLGHLAFIDTPSILYRVGNGDQITNRENNLNYAQSYLRTIQEEYRDFGKPAGVLANEIRTCLGEAHDWLAYAHMTHHHRMQAIAHSIWAMYYNGSIGNSWRTMTKAILPDSLIHAVQQFVSVPSKNTLVQP